MPVNLFDPREFGFPEGSVIYDFPLGARKAINESRLRIRGSQSYVRFWERVLTHSERERLGGDVKNCFGQDKDAARILCGLRGWTTERSVIEIAFRLNFLSAQDYEWLREVAGDPVQAEATNGRTTQAIPSWNRETGLLEFAGQPCREIRVARATTIVPVLDDFQEADWPPSIVYVNDTVDEQRIHQVCRNLNSNLNGICFSVQDQNICWHPSTSTTAS